MTKNDGFTLSQLTNGPLLAIEKESWCGHPLRTTDEEAVWIAPRRDGTGCYAAAFNLSEKKRQVTVPDLGRPIKKAMELWTGKSARVLSASLPAHDAAVWRIDTE